MTASDATRAQVLDDAPPTAESEPWQERLRRFGYEACSGADVRERLVPSFPKSSVLLAKFTRSGTSGVWFVAWGWLGPVLVAALAGAIRFWHLGQPQAVIFDETYYAKDAWSLLHLGYEGSWPERKVADLHILAHPQVISLSDTGSFVAHPPTGKWVIALGEWMFGLNPFGWRFMTATVGTLSVLMLSRIGRRMFRSTLLGCLMRRSDGSGRSARRHEPLGTPRPSPHVLCPRRVRLLVDRPGSGASPAWRGSTRRRGRTRPA